MRMKVLSGILVISFAIVSFQKWDKYEAAKIEQINIAQQSTGCEYMDADRDGDIDLDDFMILRNCLSGPVATVLISNTDRVSSVQICR